MGLRGFWSLSLDRYIRRDCNLMMSTLLLRCCVQQSLTSFSAVLIHSCLVLWHSSWFLLIWFVMINWVSVLGMISEASKVSLFAGVLPHGSPCTTSLLTSLTFRWLRPGLEQCFIIIWLASIQLLYVGNIDQLAEFTAASLRSLALHALQRTVCVHCSSFLGFPSVSF